MWHTEFLENGLQVTDVAELRKNCMKKVQFKLDVAALVPTDLLYAKIGIDYPLIRLNRLFKVFDKIYCR